MRVELVDKMGSDVSIVNAARVSFGGRTDVMRDKDKRLLDYLARNGHWSPFSHTCISLRISAPLFVARQLGKHQVGLAWNEISRRYVDSPPTFYLPSSWRMKADNAKQGSSREKKSVGDARLDLYRLEFEAYNRLLDEGVCPEQARMILPQATYTEWIWTGSLYAFHRVCKQRLDPHAQKETRGIAAQIARICLRLFPHAWKALRKRETERH